MQSLKQNEEGAFTEIYRRYWEQLYRSAYRKLPDREQVKEIIHDVLVDIWKRRASLSVSHLPAYLEKAVRFRVINYLTRKKSKVFFDLFEDVLYSPFEADSQVNMVQFMELLESLLDLLPEKRRRIFMKYYYENLSAREIAMDMDLSTKTVQNNISLTMQFLRDKLKHLLAVTALVSVTLK